MLLSIRNCTKKLIKNFIKDLERIKLLFNKNMEIIINEIINLLFSKFFWLKAYERS